MAHAHRNSEVFAWLTKLRWGAVGGQIVTIAIVQVAMKMALPLRLLSLIIALEVLSNLVATFWLRGRTVVSERALVLVLIADVRLLTALLAVTGGPSNPFNFLYLVHIALAAVVLRSGWTWALVGFSVLASGTLFFLDPAGLLHAAGDGHHAHHMDFHLEGMWVAFAVAAAFIVYFVTRIRRSLADREADLEAQRRLAARNEKLAALATLAAGAAHELATPLGTIAVAARELERRYSPNAVDLDDVALIRAQVDRCRKILDRMAADAGERAGEGFVTARLSRLLALSVQEIPALPRIRVSPVAHDHDIVIPVETLGQAIRGLLRNAQEASRPEAEVILKGEVAQNELRIEVQDRGAGMTPEVLARAGEPFFTTKAPGAGMGLGLFLTRTIAERLGGGLDVKSTPGEGTTVTLRIPADAGATIRRMDSP